MPNGHKKGKSMEMLENFAANVKRLLEDRNMSRQELAKKSEVSYAHINMILKGDRNPTLYTAIKIAHALGVTLSELLEGN